MSAFHEPERSSAREAHPAKCLPQPARVRKILGSRPLFAGSIGARIYFIRNEIVHQISPRADLRWLQVRKYLSLWRPLAANRFPNTMSGVRIWITLCSGHSCLEQSYSDAPFQRLFNYQRRRCVMIPLGARLAPRSWKEGPAQLIICSHRREHLLDTPRIVSHNQRAIITKSPAFR